jgi:hypothetical protein
MVDELRLLSLFWQRNPKSFLCNVWCYFGEWIVWDLWGEGECSSNMPGYEFEPIVGDEVCWIFFLIFQVLSSRRWIYGFWYQYGSFDDFLNSCWKKKRKKNLNGALYLHCVNSKLFTHTLQKLKILKFDENPAGWRRDGDDG